MKILHPLCFPLFLIVALSTYCSRNMNSGSPPAETWQALHDSLSPLLEDSEFATDAWRTQRVHLRDRWLGILGIPPETVPAPSADTLESVDEGSYIRYSLSLKTEDDARSRAYLLVPKGGGPFPAAVCFHSTSENTIDQPAGLADPGEKHFGKLLAERGYITIMAENYIYGYHLELNVSDGDRAEFNQKYPDRLWGRIADNTIRFMKTHPGWTGLGKMIWDGMRCVDFLQSLSSVQKDRIGAIGHSLGGKEVLFLAGLDERIACSVSSEGGVGLSFSNWFDPWYIGGKQREMSGMDNHQVLALGAPRPFLLLGGESADGDRSFAFIEHAQPIYAIYGKEENLGFYNHRQGHTVTNETLEYALDWMDRYLK